MKLIKIIKQTPALIDNTTTNYLYSLDYLTLRQNEFVSKIKVCSSFDLIETTLKLYPVFSCLYELNPVNSYYEPQNILRFNFNLSVFNPVFVLKPFINIRGNSEVNNADMGVISLNLVPKNPSISSIVLTGTLNVEIYVSEK